MRGSLSEWPETLDMDALFAAGWQPEPFQEFVLKIHSRCDLACDYCYVYTMADQGWRRQPMRMSMATIHQAVKRIAEHARDHSLGHVRVILHGGEPLLAGPASFRELADNLHSRLPASTVASMSLQTNGMHLTSANLRLLGELGIQVAVSLDGAVADHDHHRRKPNGGGSHFAVSSGLARLTSDENRHLFRGLLCTIDLQHDPVSTFEALSRYEPPAMDFLLPHGNWSAPPPGWSSDLTQAPYSDWLIQVFDHWYESPVRRARIRIFDEIMHVLLGGTTRADGIGLRSVPVAVIETDGSIQLSDLLKSAFEGAAQTELHINRDPLDAALRLPSVAARQLGATALSATCRACRVHNICGGGQYAHRYRAGNGFANRSVYCVDLYRLIRHIQHRLAVDLAKLRESC
jgi:uncharacterized protein